MTVADLRAGLDMAAGTDGLVAIHDAARPLLPQEVITGLVAAMEDGDDVMAALPVLPVVDTLKSIAGDLVTGTPARRPWPGADTADVPPEPSAEAVRGP